MCTIIPTLLMAEKETLSDAGPFFECAFSANEVVA
jgi:hypothetical protein